MCSDITKITGGSHFSGRETGERSSREILELLDEIETLAEQNYRRIMRRISEVRELIFEQKPLQPLGPRITAPSEVSLASQQLPVGVMTPEGQVRRARGMPTETEIAVLRMIHESPEKREAPVIAREIAKSREHTARLLKKMSDAGFLTRKEEVWPYTYVLTDRAQRFLENQP